MILREKKSWWEEYIHTRFAFIPLKDCYGNIFWLEKYYHYSNGLEYNRGRVTDFATAYDFFNVIHWNRVERD